MAKGSQGPMHSKTAESMTKTGSMSFPQESGGSEKEPRARKRGQFVPVKKKL